MNILATVGILILTVFLLLSAPAYAGTNASYTVYDCAKSTDGVPAPDGEEVKIYKDGDPSNYTTVLVGAGFEADGWWKADLYNVPTSLVGGDTVVIEFLGTSKTHVIDTSLEGKGGQWLSEVSALPPVANDDGSGDGSSSSGSSGTYSPTPTPTAASEPTVTTTEETTEEPTEAPPKDSTATQTETEITEFMTQSTPGFGAVLTVFAIAGLLVATYLAMRRRE